MKDVQFLGFALLGCVFAGAAVGACANGSTSLTSGAGGGAASTSTGVTVSNAVCKTTFRYLPPTGTLPKQVFVSGEWDAFSNPGTPMAGPDASGAFTGTVPLTAGLTAYKFIVDGNYVLDPNEQWQKYVGGIANSAVLVTNCHLPTLAVASNAATRPASGQGVYTATVDFMHGEGAPALDPSTVAVTLRKDGETSTVSGVTVNAASSSIEIKASGLADGKYSAFVTAKDLAGQAVASPLRLVFWVEETPFQWSDALLYMAMTDRFKDGDPTNNPKPTTVGGPNASVITVDPREDYHGGDFAGVTSKIQDGTLDQLGVRVLWLSPFYTNPSDAWIASDNVHYTTGFHGYWPIKAREVDPRWGGASALTAMVKEAHAHGIRVIMDLVVQHVHQEHEYLKTHPEWFNTTGCICGTDNCDWTVHRLDCLFTNYLPNIDWTNPVGVQQWQDDAVWWMDSFDLDGFRLDAVKQVPDIAVTNLVSALHQEFEPSGTRVFTVGETAMGWSGGDLANNASQYGTINEYLTDGLDGQFDFVLYYAVPLNVFADQSMGVGQADYWTQASGWEFVQGSPNQNESAGTYLMSPFVGSEDTARFITIASYRGQTAALDPSIPYNQWDNIAGPPPDSDTYGRHRQALAWLLSIPGVPLVYYGDEYGQWGGVDPNNRMDWRGDGTLSTDEQTTQTFVRKLGQARKNLPALRRGGYVPISSSNQDVLVFARQDTAGDVAVVAISRLTSATTFQTALPLSLGITDGTTLHDQMGGPDVTVQDTLVSLQIPAQGAVILAP